MNLLSSNQLLLLQTIVMMVVLTASGSTVKRSFLDRQLRLPCPDGVDYSPLCTCDYLPSPAYSIYCNITSAADWSLLTEIFRRTTISEHFELQLTLAQSGMSIPVDVLSDKIAQSIIIKCADESIQLSSIHPTAFAASATEANTFTIQLCSLTNFNFAFLTQINASLVYLRLHNTTLERFEMMPQLPQLRVLDLLGVRGLKALWSDAGNPEQLITPILNSVYFNSVLGMSEADLNGIGDLLKLYEKTLRNLYLIGMGLTQVPRVARELTSLWALDLSDNLMTELPAGSVALQSTLYNLRLHNVPLRTIHPDAFQGTFRSTSIRLVYNQLSTISYEVFHDLLEEMLNSTGSVYLYGNPIPCNDCKMSWLLHEKRHLMTKMLGATCGTTTNLTMLHDLDSEYFSRCSDEPDPGSGATTLNIYPSRIIAIIGLYYVLGLL